jgi:hypothetical protein
VVTACEDALRTRFARRPSLGKVFLDPRLTSYLVPFSQRSAAKALRTLVRGSRIPLPPGGTLRFFLWWKEGVVAGKATGRVDIDLTAALYGDDFAFRDQVSWTNLRGARFRGVHSGDITSAPDGACEFIDLDLASVLAFGARYVVATAFAFTSQPFCNLPECFVGWMMRRDPGSGEIFEPATVVDRVDLAADQRDVRAGDLRPGDPRGDLDRRRPPPGAAGDGDHREQPLVAGTARASDDLVAPGHAASAVGPPRRRPRHPGRRPPPRPTPCFRSTLASRRAITSRSSPSTWRDHRGPR